MKKVISFSPKQLECIYRPYDYTFDVLEGTPRSGKTTAAHFRYADYLIGSRDQNHLVSAYNQEQAFRLFIDGDGTGLMHIFDGYCDVKHDEHGDHLLIHTPLGKKKVYYKGGAKVNSVGAITGMSLGSVMFCEINLLHMDFIQECFRRTFAAQDRYFLADLNPPSPNHPVIKDVFGIQNTRWTHWTMKDNPIITEERKLEIYNTLKNSKYLLERDWHGNRVLPAGVIYSMLDMNKHVKQTLLGNPYEMYFSADGGQSDATSCSCNIVTNYEKKFRLNRVANYYHSGKDTGQTKAMSVYAREIKIFVQWCRDKYEMNFSEFFVDPACKSLREELHLVGIQTRPADNNGHDIKGSLKGIEVGIERLQNSIDSEQFLLVDNDKYSHYDFIQEVGMYCRDDNGKPVDAYNHSLDEARYANNYFYRRYVL
ncbi:PBSX family phage terminase large subunit [Alkalibaculum sp. M08DMB]|uniref:PBSX family phage terminase large subunit n=1 Tax=Alkalibaculum sporogenes TaxID=2655001 RepID=A0A6A7K9V6_9FIRM|nr:PBSX family phage terminase large subunit [Alkalibaculum sporogenes]MPW26250.1 PBSX family phage terminase large subunit [Alkalibaculum sporogenes]